MRTVLGLVCGVIAVVAFFLAAFWPSIDAWSTDYLNRLDQEDGGFLIAAGPEFTGEENERRRTEQGHRTRGAKP